MLLHIKKDLNYRNIIEQLKQIRRQIPIDEQRNTDKMDIIELDYELTNQSREDESFADLPSQETENKIPDLY